MKELLLFVFALWFNHTAFAQGRLDDSLKVHRQKFALSKKDNLAKVQLFNDLAGDYRRNNYDSAIFYGRKALILAKQIGAGKQESYARYNLEFSLRETGNLAEALNLELDLLDKARLSKKNYIEGIELNSIGNTYLEMGDPKTALEYYRKSRGIFLPLPDDSGLMVGSKYHYSGYFKRNEASNMGNAFEMMNQLDSALRYETAMYQDKNFPDDIMPELLSRLGNVQVKLGKNKEAMQLFRKAIMLSFHQSFANDRAVVYYQMAVLFNKLNQGDSSLYYGRKSFFTAKSIALGKTVLDASLLIADLYHKNSNLDSAYAYQRIAIEYKDALFGADKFRQIQLVLSQEQQRQQKLLQEREELKNRYRIIGAGAILVFVLIILLLVWRNNRVQTRQNRLLSIQKTQITTQRDEMKNTLENLHKTQTQLIQAEKMASLGELTAGIAHEIQNPLNFVNNFSEVSVELLEELKEEAKAGNNEDVIAIAGDLTQNLEKISHHGKRADAIVKGMLQHSQSGNGSKEPTNINALADECMRLAYHGLRAKDKSFNSELVTTLDEKLPKVNVIPQDMVRVMLNLFNNAFYAVNQKQKTAGADYQPTVEVETFFLPLQGVGGLKVKDNGIGIPDAIKEKIMQPFFTTKPTGEGTGLGLSLTYDMVVKGHGGKIEVETEPGVYTEFIVTLPIS